MEGELFMKEIFGAITKQLSKLGRAMLIPIAATPVAGLLARLSAPDMLNLPVLESASWVVFGMLDMLFAIGAVVAYTKVKDKTCPILGSIISLAVFKQTLALLLLSTIIVESGRLQICSHFLQVISL